MECDDIFGVLVHRSGSWYLYSMGYRIRIVGGFFMAFIIFVLIIIIVWWYFKKSNSEKNSLNSSKSRSNELVRYSLDTSSQQRYDRILNNLENIISSVANRSFCKIDVVVICQKTDSDYCEVSGSLLADSRFNNVAFENGFDGGDDFVRFCVEKAVGFTDPEKVKQEMSLQFNWSDLSISNEKFTVLDYGDYTNKPYVSYSFSVKK